MQTQAGAADAAEEEEINPSEVPWMHKTNKS
jgi:hypothetical protein